MSFDKKFCQRGTVHLMGVLVVFALIIGVLAVSTYFNKTNTNFNSQASQNNITSVTGKLNWGSPKGQTSRYVYYLSDMNRFTPNSIALLWYLSNIDLKPYVNKRVTVTGIIYNNTNYDKRQNYVNFLLTSISLAP